MIIHKSKNLVIINKPAGVPSQSDLSGSTDAMTMTANELKELNEKCDLWLVHRLDRVVGGLMVFARSQKAAAEISSLIQNGKFQKEYLAVTEGECDESGEMRNFIYKDAKISKAFIVNSKRSGVKEAILQYQTQATVKIQNEARSLVKVSLLTGRYHQIRAQFSHRKIPLVGDGKYGSRDKKARFPALFSHHISFKLFDENIDISILPDNSEYPWNIWSGIL